jgi:hypothetical protein
MACFGAGAGSLSAAATKPLLAMIFPGPDGFHMLTRLTYGLLMKYWLHLVAFGCIWLPISSLQTLKVKWWTWGTKNYQRFEVHLLCRLCKSLGSALSWIATDLLSI